MSPRHHVRASSPPQTLVRCVADVEVQSENSPCAPMVTGPTIRARWTLCKRKPNLSLNPVTYKRQSMGAAARQLLDALRERIGVHPEIGQAINKLETALAILGVQTGGML